MASNGPQVVLGPVTPQPASRLLQLPQEVSHKQWVDTDRLILQILLRIMELGLFDNIRMLALTCRQLADFIYNVRAAKP